MGMVHAGMARHGVAWFAMEQTAGKGQRGKHWLGKPGQNIALSIVLYPLNLKASQQFPISMSVALACHDFFSAYSGDETKIKWPNDLYWCDRKAGGILIENIFTGTHWKCAVVGIGININQTDFDSSIRKPVSLKQITGKEYDVVTLAKQLHQQVLKRFDELDEKPVDLLLDEYNKRLFAVNEKVRLKKANNIFETTIRSVTENGLLITSDSEQRSWNFGEVEWLLEK